MFVATAGRMCDNPGMKLIAWIAVALVVVFGGWKLMQMRDLARYGVDRDHPFGTFEKLDATLVGEMGFTKEELPADYVPYPDLPPAAHSYRYIDPQSSGGVADKVWIQVGADGRLISMSSWSRPQYTGTTELMRLHWERVTDETMDLKKGQGDYNGAPFRGRWMWVNPGGFTVCLAVR